MEIRLHGWHQYRTGIMLWKADRLEMSRMMRPNRTQSCLQRAQIENLEVWFFGVSDDRIGDDITKYMQVQLFSKKPKKLQLRRKSKEAIRGACFGARSKVKEVEKAKDAQTVGSASAVVINGEKPEMADMGDYRAVVCKDGKAYQINRRRQSTNGQHWSRKLLPGVLRMPKAREAIANPFKSLDFAIGDEKIDWHTQFAIIGCTGIWEVMKHQEAVNLIKHIEDPQEASECLAKEAITRMSRSSISCLVIRFKQLQL